MDVFAEDWNASQFWYADATAALLARNLVAGARVRDTIAVVSAPSVFVALKNAVVRRRPSPSFLPSGRPPSLPKAPLFMACS